MSGMTPSKTSGEWFYSQDTDLLTAIEQNGWSPQRHTGTKYGWAVYLSRQPWHPDVKEVLVCKVDLPDDEVLDCFPTTPGWEHEGEGNSERHLARYLKHHGVIPSNRPHPACGNSKHNIAIRDHFLKQGVRGVRIVEHNNEVLVMYDPDAIRIVERRTLR